MIALCFLLCRFFDTSTPPGVGLDMVHCRSAIGKWKHAMRSWEHGFGKRPSVACPFPPPPPPPYCGEENLEPTHANACNIGNCNIKRRWEDISDSDEFPFTPQADFICEEEDELLEKLENVCPSCVETFLLDAPLTVKDISRPKIICLSVLLELKAETTPGVSNTDVILELPSINGDFLDLPSINGETYICELQTIISEKIRQARHDMKVTLETECAAFRMTFQEQIGDLAV